MAQTLTFLTPDQEAAIPRRSMAAADLALVAYDQGYDEGRRIARADRIFWFAVGVLTTIGVSALFAILWIDDLIAMQVMR